MSITNIVPQFFRVCLLYNRFLFFIYFYMVFHLSFHFHNLYITNNLITHCYRIYGSINSKLSLWTYSYSATFHSFCREGVF